jgi:hypothetical protein
VSKKEFKSVNFKQYKMGFATRLNTKISDIGKWGPVLFDKANVAIPSIYAKIRAKEIDIEYHPDITDAHIMPDKMRDQLEGILVKFFNDHDNAKEVVLNDKLIPLAYAVDFSRWVAVKSILELFEPMTIEDIYDFSKKKPGKGKAFFTLIAIGDVMSFMSSVTIEKALAAVILDQYCYSDIPPAPKGTEFAKVSVQGFSWLFGFLTQLCGHSKPTKFTCTELYEQADKAQFVPNIPVTFNEKYWEIKLDKLAEYAFEVTVEEDEEEEDEKIIDAKTLKKSDFENYPLALGIGEFCEADDLEHGTDYYSLYKLLNNEIEDHELLFIFADEYPVIVDCDISVGKITLKKEDIKGVMLNAGNLEISVDDNLYDKATLEKFEIQLEDSLKRLFIEGVMIFRESSKMGIKIIEDSSVIGKGLM